MLCFGLLTFLPALLYSIKKKSLIYVSFCWFCAFFFVFYHVCAVFFYFYFVCLFRFLFVCLCFVVVVALFCFLCFFIWFVAMSCLCIVFCFVCVCLFVCFSTQYKSQLSIDSVQSNWDMHLDMFLTPFGLRQWYCKNVTLDFFFVQEYVFFHCYSLQPLSINIHLFSFFLFFPNLDIVRSPQISDLRTSCIVVYTIKYYRR